MLRTQTRQRSARTRHERLAIHECSTIRLQFTRVKVTGAGRFHAALLPTLTAKFNTTTTMRHQTSKKVGPEPARSLWISTDIWRNKTSRGHLNGHSK